MSSQTRFSKILVVIADFTGGVIKEIGTRLKDVNRCCGTIDLWEYEQFAINRLFQYLVFKCDG